MVLEAGLALATASKTLAYRGDPNIQGPYYSPEKHEAMLKAFENKDYNSWKNLKQGRVRVSQVINEQNFSRFAEMHKLMLEGKTEEANKIRQELGLGFQRNNMQKMGFSKNKVM